MVLRELKVWILCGSVGVPDTEAGSACSKMVLTDFDIDLNFTQTPVNLRMRCSPARGETALRRRRCAMDGRTALRARMSKAVVSTSV